MVQCMKTDSRDALDRTATADEEGVERGVQQDERGGGGAGEPEAPGDEPGGAGERRGRREPVAPAEVERARAAAALREQLHPGDSAAEQVGLDHPVEAPRLQVRASDLRLEQDERAGLEQAHAELDVLDRGPRVALRVEAAGGEERVPPDRAESRPEGRRRPGRARVHVMVQEVAEGRDDAVGGRCVVVGAEEGGQLRVGVEGRADPAERVRVDEYVGVDEDEHVAGRVPCADVASSAGTDERRVVDDEELLRRLLRSADRLRARVQRGRSVRRRDDRADPDHPRILVRVERTAMAPVLILTYHAVEPGPEPLCVAPEQFRAHLDCIVDSGVRTVTISELAGALGAGMPAEPLVAITFDDGFASVVDTAAPMLAGRGLTATVFCVAGHLGGRNDWPSAHRGGYESPLADGGALAELARGGFEIGSHGKLHEPLVHGDEQVLQEEVVESQLTLQEAVGTPVRSFAYPYGAGPSPEAAHLVAATYAAA